MRFEEPNAMTRWDSPLFVVDSNPSSAAAGQGTSSGLLPIEDIWTTITSGKISRAPGVVVPVSCASTPPSLPLYLLRCVKKLRRADFERTTDEINFDKLPFASRKLDAVGRVLHLVAL